MANDNLPTIAELEQVHAMNQHYFNIVSGVNGSDYSLNPITGENQKTIPALLKEIQNGSAFYNVGTFAAGYTLTHSRQTMEHSGHEYSWAGEFPKVVPAGSTPATSGGIGAGAWVDRTDVTLRSEIYSSLYTVKVPRSDFDTIQDWIDYCITNNKEPSFDGFSDQNTWTVASSGANFTTLSSAINFLKGANRAYRGIDSSGDNSRQYVNLQSGFVLAEQVWFEGCNLSHITITSTDAEVTITRSALTRPVGSAEIRYPAFCYRFGCHSPVHKVLFNMDSSGTSNGQGGCRVEAGSYAYWYNGSGVKNAADRGLHLINSKAWANHTIWSGAGNRGIRVGNVSEIWAEAVDCTGCSETGIAVDSGGTANIRNADCSNATIQGLLADSCIVDAGGLIANDCGTYGAFIEQGANVCLEECEILRAGSNGILATEGSVVSAKSSNVSDCTGANIYARDGAKIDFHGSTSTGSGSHNLYAVRASVIDAYSCTLTNATGSACRAEGSTIDVDGSTLSNSGIGVDSVASKIIATSAIINDCTNYGISATNGSIINAESSTVLRSGINGLLAADGSTVSAKLANISDSVSSNVLARNGANVDLHTSTCIDGGVHNIHAQRNANVDASSSTLTGATTRGCYCENATVCLVSSNISGSGGAADLFITQGGIVRFYGGTGTFGVTPNAITTAGIVFQ